MSAALTALQNQFQRYLFNQPNEINKEILSDAKGAAKTRLDIYQHSYVLRLLEALRHDYPILAQCLGEEKFQQIGRAYIAAHPSSSRSVRGFCRQLPDFLKNETLGDMLKPDCRAFWYELALFEYLLVNVFDAADDSVTMESELQQVAAEQWGSLVFRLHSSVQLVELQWNAILVWQAARNKKLEKIVPKRYQRLQTWMMWRQGLETYFSKLVRDEAWALHALEQQKTFGEICEGLGQWNPQNQLVLRAAGLLKSWMQKGLIAGIAVGSDNGYN